MDLNSISEIVSPRLSGGAPAWREGDAWLAGGTWLFSEPQPDLRRLIDLARLGWTPLSASDDGLSIAATCSIAALAAHPLPSEWTAAPLVEQCCRALLGSFKIWNTATVGGNLCLALPAGPMIALCAALDGVCTIWKADGRKTAMPVLGFVQGPQQNALGPGDLLRQIDIALPALKRRAAFRQISLNPLGRSGALLIGTLDRITGAFALTITASTRRPLQLTFASLPEERHLLERLSALPFQIYFDDIHGKPAWRQRVTKHFAREILAELGRASLP